jgi:uridine kinase
MIIIAITGGSASGKTTFAKKLSEKIPSSILLSQDNYHKDVSLLSLDEINKYNFDHPDALDLDLLIEDIIKINNTGVAHIPFYDFKTGIVSKKSIQIVKPDVLILEGLFVLYLEKLRKLIDVSIFVHADSDIRLARRIKRDVVERNCDVDSIINRYLKFVKPGHDEFVEPQREYSSVIIDEHSFEKELNRLVKNYGC